MWEVKSWIDGDSISERGWERNPKEEETQKSTLLQEAGIEEEQLDTTA